MPRGNAYRFDPLGEEAIIVRFGDEMSDEAHRAVVSLSERVKANPFPGWVENVIAYTTLTVFYSPIAEMVRGAVPQGTAYERVCVELERLIDSDAGGSVSVGKRIEIPVCYGGEFGPDLNEVAAYCGLVKEEFVRLHSSVEYPVRMIGFLPGFPYLSGLSKEIAVPRRSTPRTSVPAGSVGIGGSQTGIYPVSSPGGWQLIGRTPLRLFQLELEQPSLLEAGDVVRFVPISTEEYARIESRLALECGRAGEKEERDGT